MNYKGTFKVISWDENPTQEINEESKITRATVKQTYTGDVTGESTVHYTMYYPSQTISMFIGIEHFNGKIGDKSGELVLEHKGEFEEGVAKSDFITLYGTDDMKELQYTGNYITRDHGAADYEFILD
jgi:Protein of unknown function (DUF3224)